MSISSLLKRCDNMIRALEPPKSAEAFARYRKDPVRYMHEVLRIRHLTQEQVDILTYVAGDSRCRLLVPSANKTGKSFIASGIMSWHYDCFRPSVTICTAPSKQQVDDIVFRELRKLRRGDPAFSPKASKLTDGDDHLCYGYTAVSATSFQGRHDASVLGVFDEAEGIDPEFWEAGESFIQRWICFYNPTMNSSAAAIAERSGKWKIIRMSALTHPNIPLGEQGKPPLIPNAVTLVEVKSRLEQYGATKLDADEPELVGDITLDGERWRPSPVVEARVCGRRPSKSSDSVYGTALLDKVRAHVIPEVKAHWKLQIGCDVARYGDDFTCIHVRQGPCSIHHEAHNGWSVPQIASRLRALAIRFAPLQEDANPRDIPVLIDGVGVGGGVVDLSEGFAFYEVNSCRAPHEEQKEEYPNLRSQIAFDLEDLMKHNLVDLSRLRPDSIHDIVEQLNAMSYELGPRGMRVVLAKKEIKKALGRSPDDADAVLLSYYQFPPTLEVHR